MSKRSWTWEFFAALANFAISSKCSVRASLMSSFLWPSISFLISSSWMTVLMVKTGSWNVKSLSLRSRSCCCHFLCTVFKASSGSDLKTKKCHVWKWKHLENYSHYLESIISFCPLFDEFPLYPFQISNVDFINLLFHRHNAALVAIS